MKVKKSIILEEIQKFITESYVMNDDRFHFRQRLNNSTFYSYETFTSDYNTDVLESDIVVTWTVSFWMNSQNQGIENLVIDVESVEGTFSIEMRDKHSDEVKQEAQKNIQDFEWKFIVGDAVLEKGGSLYISDLDFDFKNKTCSVNF
jgi:hypothetical protein